MFSMFVKKICMKQQAGKNYLNKNMFNQNTKI